MPDANATSADAECRAPSPSAATRPAYEVADKPAPNDPSEAKRSLESTPTAAPAAEAQVDAPAGE